MRHARRLPDAPRPASAPGVGGVAAILVTLVALAGVACTPRRAPGQGSAAPARPSVTPAPAALAVPGITSKTITIAGHTLASGDGAGGYAEVAAAASAYFHWVNDHGGVYGRAIDYRVADDAGSADVALGALSQLLTQGDVFAVFAGGMRATHEPLAAILHRAGVPDLFVASGCACWNQPVALPMTFGFEPDQMVEGKIQGQYVASHFGTARVGYLATDDPAGRDGVSGLDSQIPPGAVVARQVVDATPAVDPVAAVAALQAAGVTVVVCYAGPAPTARALVAAAKLGYHPTWIVSSVGSDPVTLRRLVGAGGPPLPPLITDSYLANITDPADPWTGVFKRIHDRYLPGTPLDGYVEHGMALAYTFVQAMAAAGPHPTREGVVKAIEQWHFVGPGVVPLAYSPRDHRGYPGAQMATLINGVLDLTGLPMVVTAAGRVEPFAGPVAVPPIDGIPVMGG